MDERVKVIRGWLRERAEKVAGNEEWITATPKMNGFLREQTSWSEICFLKWWSDIQIVIAREMYKKCCKGRGCGVKIYIK